jgi:hypothetical protein
MAQDDTLKASHQILRKFKNHKLLRELSDGQLANLHRPASYLTYDVVTAKRFDPNWMQQEVIDLVDAIHAEIERRDKNLIAGA